MISTFISLLTSHGVKTQPFHGGALNGNDILKWYANADEIFEKLGEMCDDVIEKRIQEEEWQPHSPWTTIPCIETVREALTQHQTLLELQDSVYSSLRIIAPTEEEYVETEKRISAMKKQWRKMKFSLNSNNIWTIKENKCPYSCLY